MRVWYMGCALAFQAIEPGSSPGTRSKYNATVAKLVTAQA